MGFKGLWWVVSQLQTSGSEHFRRGGYSSFPSHPLSFYPHSEHSQLIPPSLVCLLLPCPPAPPPQPYWFGGAENPILGHVSYLFCWSLWSVASLSLCLCLIRGRSVFQGSYKKKSFQIPMRGAGEKISGQGDSPRFWGTNALTHLKRLITAPGPLQGPKP